MRRPVQQPHNSREKRQQRKEKQHGEKPDLFYDGRRVCVSPGGSACPARLETIANQPMLQAIFTRTGNSRIYPISHASSGATARPGRKFASSTLRISKITSATAHAIRPAAMLTAPSQMMRLQKRRGIKMAREVMALKKINTGTAASATGQRKIFTKLIIARPSITAFTASR